MFIDLRLFGLMMTLSIAVMATDIYIPSMALMKNDFNATESAIQQTIGISLLGGGLSSLFAGPMADHFGQQKVFTSAMLLFIITGILSVYAPSLSWLYTWRFFQGVAVGVFPVVTMAIIMELYSGKKLTQIISMSGVVLAITISLSPFVGGWIGNTMGWKGCFWVSSACMFCFLILLWGRLSSVCSVKSFSVSEFVNHLKILVYSKQLVFYTLIHGICWSTFLTIRSTLSHYCADVFHFTPLDFGQFMSGAMVINAVAGIGLIIFVEKIKTQRLLDIGLVFIGLSAFVAMGLNYAPTSKTGLLLFLILLNISIPFILNASLSLASNQENIPKGLASSMIVFSRSCIASLCLYVGGVCYNQTLISVTCLYICLTLGLICLYFFKKPKNLTHN